MWSEKSLSSSIEHQNEVSTETVIEDLKNVVDSTNVNNLVIILDEGLTSQSLIETARHLNFLQNYIIQHSTVYMNVNSGFESTLFNITHDFEISQYQYTLSSIDELPVLVS